MTSQFANNANHDEVWRHTFPLDCSGGSPGICVPTYEEEKRLCGLGASCQNTHVNLAKNCIIGGGVPTQHGAVLVYGPTADGYPSGYSFVVNNSESTAVTRYLTILNGAAGVNRVSSGRIKVNGTTVMDTTTAPPTRDAAAAVA